MTNITRVWKYLDSKGIKHRFYAVERKTSVCGLMVRWYSDEQWQSDKEGLERRRECKSCVRIWNS